MQNAVPIRVQLGSFEFDLKTGELRKNRRKIRLQEQPFQILLMLVEGNAVLWKDDHMLNLGTLGGYESSTNYVNESTKPQLLTCRTRRLSALPSSGEVCGKHRVDVQTRTAVQSESWRQI